MKKKPKEDRLDEVLTDNTDLNIERNKKSEEDREKKFFEAFNTAFLKDGNALWAGEIKIGNKLHGIII